MMTQTPSLDTLEKKIKNSNQILALLKNCKKVSEKIEVLNQLSIVNEFFISTNPLHKYLLSLNDIHEYVIKSIIAIDQGPILFNQAVPFHKEKLEKLIQELVEIEKFYDCIGGVIGYHSKALYLTYKQAHPNNRSSEHQHYICPKGLNLDQTDQTKINLTVRWGIESLDKIFEMYPIGGAGDRLNLKDVQTNEPLPVAVLPFEGKSLLEGLIRDVQGREYLYFKLTKKQIVIPIVLMTSSEKNNHSHILQIFEKHDWFGRPQELFFFIKQPLVPVITEEGNWSLIEPFKLSLKPSGHGVIWKLAAEQGVFKKLESLEKHDCIIRQINNPIAGTNNALLALSGLGYHEHKSFGFLSCERLKNSSEGIDVIIESHEENQFNYCLTNIEYTEFNNFGINASGSKNENNFSAFPTNTNILYAHIPTILEALKTCPIPGQLINMKTKVSYIDSEGHQSWMFGGRLESTMQNIADYLVDHFSQPLSSSELSSNLKTFFIHNSRQQTISTTKKQFKKGESPDSTPEQAFYNHLHNHYLLLKECGFKLPEWMDFESTLENGPSCIFLFHPALGPLYSVVNQKIKTGHFHKGAELQLEIAETFIENLNLKGSFLINAKSPLGNFDNNNFLHFGFESRCYLKNCTVINRGINDHLTQDFWKNAPIRDEQVEITLNNGSEFWADGITIEGNYHFEVPAYHRLVLQGKGKDWTEVCTPIQSPSWHWNYTFDSQNKVHLEMKFN